MAIDKKFIITMPTKTGPKDFILFAGLLDAGHNSGLTGIETAIVPELSQPEKDYWVARAVGRFLRDGVEQTWIGHGDAHAGNSQMKGAYLRHAETRAAARMLRFATNIGMTAAEEMGPDYDDERETRTPRAAASGSSSSPRTVGPKPATADQRGTAAGATNGVVGDGNAQPVCSVTGCGTLLSPYEVSGCAQKGWPMMCTLHAKEEVMRLRAEAAAGEPATAA